jgi:hypothetical protein
MQLSERNTARKINIRKMFKAGNVQMKLLEKGAAGYD